MSSSTERTQSAYEENTRGMPTRGNAWKSGVRALARPVSRPCQNGELADSASSSGRCARIWFSAASAPAGVGTPTWTCSANVGSRRASARIEP